MKSTAGEMEHLKRMSIIEKSIEVNVPAYVAYSKWMRFEDHPRFMQGVKEVKNPALPGGVLYSRRHLEHNSFPNDCDDFVT